jgi:hypothetical protein
MGIGWLGRARNWALQHGAWEGQGPMGAKKSSPPGAKGFWLSTSSLTPLPSRLRKWLPPYIELYNVIEYNLKTLTYKLDLPAWLMSRGITPTFHLSQLRPWITNEKSLCPNRLEDAVQVFPLDKINDDAISLHTKDFQDDALNFEIGNESPSPVAPSGNANLALLDLGRQGSLVSRNKRMSSAPPKHSVVLDNRRLEEEGVKAPSSSSPQAEIDWEEAPVIGMKVGSRNNQGVVELRFRTNQGWH